VQFRRAIASAMSRTGGALTLLAQSLYMPVQARRVAPWFAADGDHTLRMDYPLSSDSIVFDLGGYEGQWASDIFARYCCQIHVFEPVKEFADGIRKRFEFNSKIRVNDFGLAGGSRTDKIHRSANASSTFNAVDGDVEEIKLIDAQAYLRESGVVRIDLLKVNIEGGEYEVLERLLDIGAVPKIRDLQIQFHDFVPDAEARMKAIQSRLAATHRTTYQYPFVWENWTRRD